jgi:hypothetical protein
MQLARKADKVVQVDEKKPVYKKVYVDWKLYEPDVDSVIAHGKYVGKTLGYIQATDTGYYTWMQDNDIIAAWGLIRLREQKNPVALYAADMSRWIAIVECTGTGRICLQEWLK